MGPLRGGVANILLPLIRAGAPADVKARLKARAGCPSMDASLRNMRDRCGFTPRVVVDVGAHRGEWTRMCKTLFPQAAVLKVEPLPACADDLRLLTHAYSDVQMCQALLGATEGLSVRFYENETTSSVLPEWGSGSGPARDRSLTTLDALTAGTPFELPDFLKIDVQGYELEVLKGVSVALTSIEAIVMELNLIDVNVGAPLFYEACHFMAERGFRLYDICTLYRRPLDGALWQVDGVFVNDRSPLVRDSSWGAPA